MIYTFKCPHGHITEVTASISEGPPRAFQGLCGHRMERDWQADAPMIDTSACRDHNFIPHQKRVASGWDRGSEQSMEVAFQRDIQNRRAEIKQAGGQRGSIKQTHKVPAHLFHGKIKETGDKNYWSDSKNLNRHKECEVDR